MQSLAEDNMHPFLKAHIKSNEIKPLIRAITLWLAEGTY